MAPLTQEILSELESLGTAQNRKIYGRHGVTAPCFGVSYGNLDKFAKRLRKSPAPGLPTELWATGNHDARILALKVIRAEELSARLVDRWAREADSPVLAGELGVTIGRTAWDGREKAVHRWLAAKPTTRPQVAASGWCLLAALAGETIDWPDDRWIGFLDRIEDEIVRAPDRIRHAMNNALIAIGSRSPSLRKRAEAAARRIGPVEVDHGETSCQTPDALAYLAKVWARKSTQRARHRC